MEPVRLKIGVDEGAAELVRQGLRAFNDANCPLSAERRNNPNDLVPVQVFALGPEGEVAGGALGIVMTTFRWLEINVLFVSASSRGRGIGTRLMDAMEELGREHGCTRVRLGTWDFQALEFYKARGYQVYGVLPDFPEGNTDYHLWKRL